MKALKFCSYWAGHLVSILMVRFDLGWLYPIYNWLISAGWGYWED